ncbi:hypothetical protein STSP_40070 [Streptomyces jeddahensis]|uniref:Uncharacterized protein n=1 Tax=Streptomyces jeddahensis TaxID=1716141 RepID=A0A177HNS5_9ACTN|nr:hypothetical protein STSP_40070 [Streptomyces jeddahensis]
MCVWTVIPPGPSWTWVSSALSALSALSVLAGVFSSTRVASAFLRGVARDAVVFRVVLAVVGIRLLLSSENGTSHLTFHSDAQTDAGRRRKRVD